ncbi:MAG TPA: YeeE/YedE thiosulfate transporter family protein [Ohtaekwangia sp.]|nr:YeeE/YedE thiosulfate transporter family protein [Ohtaekwangia sp.]
MNDVFDRIRQPWPWYVAGPLIGLTVPLLLILGNKLFGISSSLRHICAACIPAKISFFNYNWKKEVWNLFFVAGIFFGGYVAAVFLTNDRPVTINENLREELAGYGIKNLSALVPSDLFHFEALFTLKGFLLIVVGGFLVGFGTRYAGGCTSGHAITGISMLQLPSIIATACFMIGGIIMANFVLPYILML